MLDRIFYRTKWFDLPNQRLLEESFWQGQHNKKLLVGHPAHHLLEDEYSCDWKIDSRKLWLLSAIFDEDGTDLLTRLLPGDTSPVFAVWYSGTIDANGESYVRKTADPSEECRLVPIIRFHIEDGIVKKTEHFDMPPQFGWNEDEPSLRVRGDWTCAPDKA